MKVRIKCQRCGKRTMKEAGHVNRVRKLGDRLFCSRRCSHLAHRTDTRTPAQKRADKAAYDAEYRRRNRALLKRKRAAYFQRTYDPVKAARERKKRMPYHVEYCRQPAYRAKKSIYDRKRRAAEFGPFAEAQMLCIDLNRAIKERMSNYEIRQANSTLNKVQERRRQAGEERDRHRNRPTDGRGFT